MRGKTIEKGPASRLEQDASYIIIPKAENPKNIESVMSAVESFALKVGRRPPFVFLEYGRCPILGFTPHKREVHVHSLKGNDVPYNTFIEALETLIDTY